MQWLLLEVVPLKSDITSTFALRCFGLLWMIAMSLVCGPLLAADFDCVIEPRQVLEIRSPLEGLIERVNVNRGDYVTKGQIVAVLDTSLERAAAAVAKQRSEMEGPIQAGQSRVEFSGKNLERVTDLQKKNFVSAQARDQAATEQRIAEAELRSARENQQSAELEHKRQIEIIRQKTIYSPVNGVVMERILNPGELSEAGVGRKPILKIAEIDVLHVEVVLPVAAYGSVKPGTVIDVTSDGANGSVLRATVKVVDKVLDAASGTFGVRLELLNPRRAIPAGVRCKASFPGIEKGTATKTGISSRTATPVLKSSKDLAIK